MLGKDFKALVASRKSKGIKKPKPKPVKWLYPNGQERQYNSVLRSLVLELNNRIREILIPQLPTLIQDIESKTPDPKLDDFFSELQRLIFFINSTMQQKVESTIKKADEIALDISKFNKAQFQKVASQTLGIDLFIKEPYLVDQLRLFSTQNSQLINSLVDEELERVSGIVERGVQQGAPISEVTKEIQKSFGIDTRRARTIARDQTAKLNASLTRLRQMEIGVEKYEWQTSGDERVRATHKANANKIFSWDSPPKVTGHPGHDVNCRCVASPILDDLIGDIF